ncbi:MAG: phosphoribosylglycinamide formyltransferase [Planctomycetaceae bacterium]
MTSSPATNDSAPLPIVVLISGSGTTLRNLLNYIAAGKLNARVELVISSNPRAGGRVFAEQAGIPYKVIERKKSYSPEEFCEANFSAIRATPAKLVVMGGYLKHLLIPEDFAGRVINIHPSLIPSFCGKGMYGHFVHEAVLAFGAKLSGCTVHFVDNEFDHGPIIAQQAVPVLAGDSPDVLAKRVFEQECQVLPAIVQKFSEGRIHLRGRHVSVD